jgi:hypothetical protein
MADQTKKELKAGDFAYITNKFAKEFPEMVDKMWRGVHIKSVDNQGVATVEIIQTHQINLQYLVDPLSSDAYDPIL